MNDNLFKELQEFLLFFLKEQKLSYHKFVNRLSELTNETERLTVSPISKFLKEGNSIELREDTLKKIAIVVFNDKHAKTDDLWIRVKKFKNNKNGTYDEIKIGTGFTCYSSFLISLINQPTRPDDSALISFELPKGVSFVFSDDKSGNPFWIDSREKLDTFKNSDRDNHKIYIADDLKKRLDDGSIDFALLLRPTFEAMYKEIPENKKPVLISRVGVGPGTHMYILKVKEEGEVNENIKLEGINDIFHSYEKFIKIINDKRVYTLLIGNQTITEHWENFSKNSDIKNSLSELIDTDNIVINDTDKYKEKIKTLAKEISEGKIDNIIIVAFEPLNYKVFRSLLRESLEYKKELVYYNFKLSKMLMERTSYGLYSSIEALGNSAKFVKIVEFLNVLNEYIKFQNLNKETFINNISLNLSKLYYNLENSFEDDIYKDNIKDLTRMEYAIKDLEYSNHTLSLLNYLSKRYYS